MEELRKYRLSKLISNILCFSDKVIISGCEFALVGEDDEEQEEGQVDGELHGQAGGGGGEGRGASWLLREPPSLHLDCD